MVNQIFSEWALSFAGCDGGDLGTKERPSTWVCGIEWGGGENKSELESKIHQGPQLPSPGYDNWQANLDYIFNWQAVKLLSVISGKMVQEYKAFAEQVRPFVKGSSGYFKMNLYPLAFRNTDAAHWSSEFASATGFPTKQEYLEWCALNRFPLISSWAKIYRPALVIGLGKTYRDDFGAAFSVSQWNEKIIEQRQISWAKNETGSLVVVLPFMVNRNGLTRNLAIQQVGQYIFELLSNN